MALENITLGRIGGIFFIDVYTSIYMCMYLSFLFILREKRGGGKPKLKTTTPAVTTATWKYMVQSYFFPPIRIPIKNTGTCVRTKFPASKTKYTYPYDWVMSHIRMRPNTQALIYTPTLSYAKSQIRTTTNNSGNFYTQKIPANTTKHTPICAHK